MIIRLSWKRIVGAVALVIAAALLFAWSGLFNIAASSGHWRITDWGLHWVMRNSVRTHAALNAPDDPRANQQLVSAAGHFAASCAACHGAPGIRPSPVMQAAAPPAPDLAINAPMWTDKQLFWIIKHGIKFTGMPGWPAVDRDDEVRRMVAFVRQMPTMTPKTYRALTAVPASNAEPGRCTGCHGVDGRGRGQPDIPILGGQSPAYLVVALQRYATGKRSSAVMQTAAATLDGAEMTRLARHFAAFPGVRPALIRSAAEPRNIAQILDRGMPGIALPACTRCHAAGKSYPALAGQRASYIAQRLRQWRGDDAIVDARKPHETMPVIARRIPEDQIDRLAAAISKR